MKIENSFTIEAPIADTWELLTDMSVIAHCLPGVTLSGEDQGVYAGSVRFKLGPVTAEYQGSTEFIEKDEAARELVIDSKATDLRGSGDARALISAHLTDGGAYTQVRLSTDLQVTGKVAQFGRGVMQESSKRMVVQFAGCLTAKFDDAGSLEAAATESADPDNAAPDNAVTTGPAASEAAESQASADDDQLDLLHVAGQAVAKRVVPLALVVLALVVILLVVI